MPWELLIIKASLWFSLEEKRIFVFGFFLKFRNWGGNLASVINKYFYTSTQKILKKSMDLENYMEMGVNLHFLES